MRSAAIAAKGAAPSLWSSASSATRSLAAPVRLGRDALGYAWRAVRDDDADVMIAGGADAIFSGAALRLLPAARDDELPGPPGTQMRPF